MRQLNLNQLNLLNRIITRIRRSLELQEILETTVAEVRSFLKTDRVKIYKFDSDGNGQVIAESRNRDKLPSLRGLYFPADDIPPQARELFCKARVRSIVNVHQQEIHLSEPNRFPSTATEELTVEEVRQQPLNQLLKRSVDPCHVEYLTLMGVQSSVVIPILSQGQLWGLLISHNAKPKTFTEADLQLVQMIAEQVEIAIAQSDLLRQAQEKATHEAIVNQISTLLHTPLETHQRLEIVLRQVVDALKAQGGVLCLTPADTALDRCYVYGQLPQFSSQKWSSFLNQIKIPTPEVSVVHLATDPAVEPFFPAFADTQIRGMISTSIQYQRSSLGHLALFREAIQTERLWAGYGEPDQRQQRPRQSFEEWREIIRDQVPEWTVNDRTLLKSLGSHIAMAVMQERLYQQQQQQRVLVEMRNQELSQARQAAEEANRLKSDFLSSTSHELRTPLASALNYLKLLKEGFYDDNAELREYIEAAYLSTKNLTTIINEVLDIAKIEAGRMAVEMQQINLPTLMKSQQRLFKIESLERGVNLVIDCQVETAWADENKLQQILTNLIANAFKFTEAGEVRVRVIRQPSLEESPPMVLFSVIDTGIGIEPNKQAQLFEAFVQEDGSIRRRYGGTGLGLTICKQLVELMGGRIWLESAGRNQGTTVNFTLPDLNESVDVSQREIED